MVDVALGLSFADFLPTDVQGRPLGDYYAERLDNHQRGISIPETVDSAFSEAKRCPAQDRLNPSAEQALHAASSDDGFLQIWPLVPQPQRPCEPRPRAVFGDGREPPEVPADPLFHLACTTLHVTPLDVFLDLEPGERKNGSRQSAATFVGLRLLDFLAEEVDASVSKVRGEKFWIKADVFAKRGVLTRYEMCSLKIRIYKAGSGIGSCVVEFSRYGGNSLVFNAVFAQASKYLERFAYVEGGPTEEAAAWLCAPPPLATAPDSEVADSVAPAGAAAALGPVLDMAAMASQPAMQAESAAMLAELAEQSPEQADDLCTDEVLDAVRHLLRANFLAAIFPAARLLRLLAGRPRGKDLIANARLLEEIVAKVRGDSGSDRLRLATAELELAVLSLVNVSADLRTP
eukprot:TRINITY_DN21945_c0_g1_i1.p1 TRINITY_DN21945_c0_g1~~TRINITY_DN21945_c0_g1_i1.p1  ORF type:complete len:403 (+),score=87.48 TRINITY_DN21945_c0_g1_i1:150-1358(+)